ncbi:hypothetical protein GL50803_008738 [Giardia duodenalis]|uniref:Uncharacterized protein n=1 Tax=Giardia intestinalis (strain ATCC 50803 / WB clone C6) TaxID=184922 RepID=A8BUD4_GIAIC|nr:hypothetical protein GL50803_008738 [Giardia intestinalis]KAE8305492.1 hypothetical protein GL50803_008738 [Giardia intestinalis]|eukprot:XP_001704760.1 Hypothetical protein GL50803_8738 [Giardia lamblia ATCC 50803]
MFFEGPEEVGTLPSSDAVDLLPIDLDGSGAYSVAVIAGRQLLLWRAKPRLAPGFSDQTLTYDLLEDPVTLAVISLPNMTPSREFVAIIFRTHVTVVGLLSADSTSLSSIFYLPLTSSLSRDNREVSILRRYCAMDITSAEAAELLRTLSQELHQERKTLSELSQRFLSLPDPSPADSKAEQYPLQTGLFQSTGAAVSNRARLLDNYTLDSLTTVHDEITCIGTLTIDAFDSDNGPSGKVLVVGTMCCFIYVYSPGFTQVLVTIRLPERPRSIQIEGHASKVTALDEPTWRGTILAGHGSIYTLRGSSLAKNVISFGSILRFVHRINRAIFAVTVGNKTNDLLRLSAKGKLDFVYALPCTVTHLSAVHVDLGRPFLGFALALSSGAVAFVAETGVTTIVRVQSDLESMNQLSAGLSFKAFCFSRLLSLDAHRSSSLSTGMDVTRRLFGVFYVRQAANKLLHLPLAPNTDLNKSSPDDGRLALQDHPLDVEQLGNKALSLQDKVLPLADQQEMFKSFISSRAYAKAMVQATLLAMAQDEQDPSATVTASTLQAVTSVELAGLNASLTVTVCNASSEITLGAMLIVNSAASPLKLRVCQARIPPLPPGATVHRHFAFTVDEALLGTIIPAHNITVLLTKPTGKRHEAGNNLLQEISAHIPELRL